MFLKILERLNERLDNCTALPNSSVRRIRAVIRKLDEEEEARITKEIEEQIKKNRRKEYGN